MSASETRGGTTSDNLHLGLSGRVHFIYSSSGSEKGTEELPTGNLLDSEKLRVPPDFLIEKHKSILTMEDNIELLKPRGNLKEAIFGILYTLSKEKEESSWKKSVVEIAVHFVQLLVILVASHFSWDFRGAWWAEAVMSSDFTVILQDIGFAAFSAIFWAQFVLLVVSVFICAWVGYSFKTGSFPFVWPIRFVRFFVSVFIDVFYIAAVAVFLMSFRCTRSNFSYYHSERSCNELPHLPAVIVSLPAALATIALGYMVSIAKSELNPLSKDLLATSFTSATSRVFMIYTVMDILDVLVSGTEHRSTLAGSYFVMCTYALTLYFWHAPYLRDSINILEAGLSAILVWISGMLFLLELITGSEGANSNAAQPISLACAAGIIPSFFAGGITMWLRLRPARKRAMEIREQVWELATKAGNTWEERESPSIKSPYITLSPVEAIKWAQRIASADTSEGERSPPSLVFRSATEVEIVSRCLRLRNVNGSLQEGWLIAAYLALKEGQRQFPDSARIHMLLGNLLASTVPGGAQAAADHFATVRRFPINSDLQFQCFCRAREHAQSAGASSGAGASMDLVSFVEYQNSMKSVQKLQSGALGAMSQFWGQLLPRNEPMALSHMLGTLQGLSALALRADRLYQAMLDKYPENVPLIRLYASFLADVRSMPARAVRLYAKADSLEDEQARAKQGSLMGGGAGDGALVSPDDGLVVANGNGIIQLTNRALNKLFGYETGELVGMNVSVLMPRPFSQRHDAFISAFKAKRTSAVMGKDRVLIGLHRDGAAFPIHVKLSHVTQDGTDQFIGAIRKAEVERDRGLLYMAIDGTILCASKGFTSILGWESNELFGQALHNLSHEGVQLAKALTTIQDAAATGTQGAAQPPNGPGTPGGALLERKRSSVGGGVGTKSPLKQPGRVSVQDKPTADAKDREMAPLTRGASQRFQEQLAEQSGGGQRCVLVQGVASLMRHKYLKGGLECTADFAALLSSSRYDVFEVSFAAQSNPRALLVCATDGRLVHASTAAEDLLGYPRGSLLESSAVIGNLMPRGFGDFHTSRLQAVTGHRGVHVPCQMGQVVLLRGGQGAMVPVQLSWWLQRVEGSPSPVYVCSLKRVQREFALSAWGMRLTEGSVERQVCLRTLISPGGRMLSVGHGVGFSASNIPGAVYGVNALGMVGANLADHIDVLQGMIKAARRFNKNLSADEVMRSTLPQLARSCVQSTTAFRAGILCPLPDNQGEERVPVRLVVKPASDTRVSAPSLAKLGLWGCTEDELADAAKDGYVVDLWSANWLLGEVEVTGTGTVRGISPEMELLSGSQAKVVVGSPVHALFTEESGRSVAAVASGRQSSAEVSLRHVDGSAPRVTVLGPGTPVPRSQRRVVLLVRATGESVEAEMDMLHRIQVMVERDTPHSEILPIQHAVMRQLSKGVAGTASGRRSTVDEGPIVQARERRGSKVAFVELIDEGAPAPKDSSSAGATGAVEHSHGGKSELESKDGGSDSDSDFGGGVGGGADNADDAVSQGVGRTHFRRSKHYKKIFELFRKSRLVQKLSMLLPSILTILSAGILLHVVLFAVMATLVQANKYKISRASTAGDIYIATARLPLQARRLQNAAAGGLWGVDLSIDMLRDDMGNILDDLIAQARSNYTGRGNKSAALVERLQRGVQYTFLLDKDLGDGEGAREVTPGPTEEGGLLRLTELLMSNAEYVRRAPQELLARSPSDSREWRFTVEGPQETFLPMQSLLLGVSYDRAGADVTSLQRNVLVLGLVQALVVMPLCTLVALLRTRALLAEKARVFTVFLSVPRAVAFRLATGRGTETASASMRGRAPLDLVTTLTEEERRAVRKLDRPAGRTMRKLLRFMEPIRQLRNDTWRLQVVVALPLVIITTMCVATHLIVDNLLGNALVPVSSYEETFRVQALLVEVRFWANEMASMTSLGRDVNPWGVTYDEAVQELKASANKLGSSWTKLLFGDQSAGTEGVAYLSAGLESIIFSPGCIREDEATCYGPEHPYFSGTSKGLNQTMSSLIMEALIFAEEERSAVLTGWRFGFIWEVTYVDLQHGVDLVGQELEREVDRMMTTSLLLEGCLLAVILVTEVWFFWFLRPRVRAGMDEVKWAAHMLSQLPEVMDVVGYLQDELVIANSEDSNSEEAQGNWIDRVGEKIKETRRRVALGGEYEDYLKFKAWQETQGASASQVALGKAPKAMDFVRRLALRPLLGRTYRVWDEITKVYKRQGRRIASEEADMQGRARPIRGADPAMSMPMMRPKNRVMPSEG